MIANREGGGTKRAGAALLAALMIAGTSLPALAAGEGSDKSGGEKPAETTEMSVQDAWANAKEDWRELQEASGDAWGDARQEFEKSWSRLQSVMSEQDGTAPPPDDPAALEEDENAE